MADLVRCLCPLGKALFHSKRWLLWGPFRHAAFPVWPRSNQSARVFDLPPPTLRHHMLLGWFWGIRLSAKPKQGNGIKLVITLICSASQHLNNGRTEKEAANPTCAAVSQPHRVALERLPCTDFLWQMCQHLILLSSSFSYFTPGARDVARPDKKKFIGMQATESLE